jgi:hypothetical protein
MLMLTRLVWPLFGRRKSLRFEDVEKPSEDETEHAQGQLEEL